MKLDIIGKRKIFFGISIVALVLVLINRVAVKLNVHLECNGGSIDKCTQHG